VQFNDGERRTLAELGKQLGKQASAEVLWVVVTPETVLV